MDPKAYPSQELGKRIVKLRKQTHLSRRAFGEKHGIPRGSLQNWEDGRYQSLTKSAIEVLLRAFAAENIPCTAEYLLYGTQIPPELRVSDHHAPYPGFRRLSTLIEKASEYAKLREFNQELLAAVSSGRSEEVQRLLTKAVGQKQNVLELEFPDLDENSLLHEAAKSGHLNVLKILIEYGSKTNIKNKFHQTPLHLAVKHGYEEIVNYLILNGAQVNTADKEGDAPLAWACKAGQTSIARQLIKVGAHLNTKNLAGYTPMHWAATNGFDDT
ncbi:MAG TPA: ankyrin repeat domain-containing protein, partial [Coxiellaceae bacterium]|nr:ankyrin repeat domain-containing protein [Coxiellaceae bacterium]